MRFWPGGNERESERSKLQSTCFSFHGHRCVHLTTQCFSDACTSVEQGGSPRCQLVRGKGGKPGAPAALGLNASGRTKSGREWKRVGRHVAHSKRGEGERPHHLRTEEGNGSNTPKRRNDISGDFLQSTNEVRESTSYWLLGKVARRY